MSENFTITEQLIQYLDNELDDQERLELEKKIAADAGIKEELDNLRIAQQAVNSYGLKQKVTTVHREMMNEIKASKTVIKKPALIRTFMHYGARVAATILVLLFCFTIYQYVSLSAGKLYSETYSSYQLSQTRGTEENNTLEEAYKHNNDAEVIQLFEKQTNPTVPAYFIAGQSYLKKENAAKAIQCFTSLQQKNKEQQGHLFEEESAYYLALAYLLNHEPQKALPLFEEIFNNKNHAYHDKVSRWTLLKLRWLIQKS